MNLAKSLWPYSKYHDNSDMLLFLYTLIRRHIHNVICHTFCNTFLLLSLVAYWIKKKKIHIQHYIQFKVCNNLKSNYYFKLSHSSFKHLLSKNTLDVSCCRLVTVGFLDLITSATKITLIKIQVKYKIQNEQSL